MPLTLCYNHFIVGLGGTGGSIIRSLRKLIFQNCRQDNPDGVNLRYLYVDTSNEIMRPNDPTWKILGHSVQLPERSQMHIAGLNLRNILDNLNSFPGIAPWLGSREDFAPSLPLRKPASLERDRSGVWGGSCSHAKRQSFADVLET
jgi:hypothetical protein